MKLFTRSRIATGATAVAVAVVLTAGTAAALFGSSTTAAIGVSADSIPTAAAPSVAVAGTTASVSFDAISLTGGRPVQSYELLRDDVTVLPCASSPCDDTGLAPGTYTYRVRGVYQQWHGEWSPASDGATVSASQVVYLAAASGTTSRSGNSDNWSATITVTVRDQTGALAAGALVSGTWSNGAAPLECTTDATGTCPFTTSHNTPDTSTQRTWTLSSVSKPGHSTGPSAIAALTCARSGAISGSTTCSVS